MCADLFNLKECLREFEASGIELLHLDIMDGDFVPNYTLGTTFIKALKKETFIPLDLHLMINEPERKLEWFDFGPGDYVTVHFEACKHVNRAVNTIHAKGAKAMVGLNPGTPLCCLDSLLDDIDGVLLMTVNPGFAGQKLIKSTLQKLKMLREKLDQSSSSHLEIEVDGNVSFEHASEMSRNGADLFVSGSSGIFSPRACLSENIRAMRKAVESR